MVQKLGGNKEKKCYVKIHLFDYFLTCFFSEENYFSSSKLLRQKTNPAQNTNENQLSSTSFLNYHFCLFIPLFGICTPT